MILSHDIFANWLRAGAALEYQVKIAGGAVLIDWTAAGVTEESPAFYAAYDVQWDGAQDVHVFWRDELGGTAEEFFPAGSGESIVGNDELNRPNNIILDIVQTLAGLQLNGLPVFDSVGAVNDVASFVRVAEPVRVDGKTVCGVVEGTIEETRGWNSDERGSVRLPFEIVIRFAHRRRPGDTETAAMQRSKMLLQAAKEALMVDPSRGGNAGLVYWNGDVINGTTVKGTARQLTGRTPNEAFFTAATSGACAWVKLY